MEDQRRHFQFGGCKKKKKTKKKTLPLFPWAVTMAAIDSAGITLLMLRKRNSFICYRFLAATIKKKKKERKKSSPLHRVAL